MPTQSEQKALAFVAIVVLLAGAVRVVRAGGPVAAPTAAEQQGIARQAFAANSAAVAQKAQRGGRSGAGSRGASKARGKGAGGDEAPRGPRYVAPRGGDGGARVVGGVQSVPWNDRLGFPPPVPRIDIGRPVADTSAAAGGRAGAKGASGPGRGGTWRRKAGPPTSQGDGPVDLDTAGEDRIQTLPRVGPALARRIVANRDSLGPFRSLEGLRRVKGIGPATAAVLGPLVTFSRQARP